MKLFFYEIKKLWSRKDFLIFFALLACANLFLLWFGTTPKNSSAPPSAYRKMTDNLRGLNAEEKEKYIEDSFTRISGIYKVDELARQSYSETGKAEAKQLFKVYGKLYYSGKYLEFTDNLNAEYNFLKEISDEYTRVKSYSDYLDNLEREARLYRSMPVFSSSGNYNMLDLGKALAAFENMQDVETDYYPGRGIEEALNFKYSDLILLLGVLLLSLFIITSEREVGIVSLIRSTSRGRIKTAAAKYAVVLASLLVLSFVIYGTNLVYCDLAFGLGDMTRSVQSVPLLVRCTLKVNVWQYVAIFVTIKRVFMSIIGLWALTALTMSKNIFTGFIACASFTCICYLIRYIAPYSGKYSFIRYSNPVSLLYVNEFMGNYRNIPILSRPVSLASVEGISRVCFWAFLLFLFFLVFNNFSPVKLNKVDIPIPFLKKISPVSVTGWEMFKLFILNGAAITIPFFLIFQIYIVSREENYISAEEMYTAYYMKNLTGPYDREAAEFLSRESEKFSHLSQAEYFLSKGVITYEEYSEYFSDDRSLTIDYKVFRQVLSKIEQLKYYPGAQLVYETGYEKLFDLDNSRDDRDYLLTVIFVSLILGGFFCKEGTANLVKSTPSGREQTVRAKKFIRFSVSAFVTSAIFLGRIWQMYKGWGFEGMFVPAKSLSAYRYVPRAIPVIALIILQFSVRLLTSYAISMIVSGISRRCSGYLSSVMYSLLILGFPALLHCLGVRRSKWFTLYNLFHFVSIISTGKFFVPLAYLALTVFLCHKLQENLELEYLTV